MDVTLQTSTQSRFEVLTAILMKSRVLRDVTPCRLVDGWCWFRLQGMFRVRVVQRHVSLSLRINAALHPRRYESSAKSAVYMLRNSVGLSPNDCRSGNAAVDVFFPRPRYLINGTIFGRNLLKAKCVFRFSVPSGQSFWLQIQRSRVRFPALPDFSE